MYLGFVWLHFKDFYYSYHRKNFIVRTSLFRSWTTWLWRCSCVHLLAYSLLLKSVSVNLTSVFLSTNISSNPVVKMNIRNARVSRRKERQTLVQSWDSGCVSKPILGIYCALRIHVQRGIENRYTGLVICLFISSSFSVLLWCTHFATFKGAVVCTSVSFLSSFHLYRSRFLRQNSHNLVIHDHFQVSLRLLQIRECLLMYFV